MKQKFTLSVLLIFLVSFGYSQAFTEGNLIVYRAGDGSTALVNTGSPVFLDEYTPAGVLVQSVAMPTTVSGSNFGVWCSGTATSEGFITRSADGRFIIVTGYANSGTSSLSGTTGTANNRVVATVNNAKVINSSTALTDYASGNNPRSACSSNGTDLWMVGGTGGVRYATVGSTTSTQITPAGLVNLRVVNIFDGQLYTSTNSTASGNTAPLLAVGTGLTTTAAAASYAALPGLPALSGTSYYSYFFADVNATVPGPDVLYIADDGASGGILKFSLVGGSWVANGSITATAVRGLTGTVSGSTVNLYATTGGSSAAGGGTIYALTDASGYNATISGTVNNIATAGTNTAFRGIAMAPIAAPLPVNLLSFNGSLINGNVKLWWSTSNETDLSHFSIEKSNDSRNFTTMATIKANNTPEINGYTFNDDNVANGLTYYRLKMVNKDGGFTVSSTIAIRKTNEIKLSVFPNPGKENITISHATAEKGAVIQIIGLDGAIAKTILLQTGATQTAANIKDIKTGNYSLVLVNGNEQQAIKFIKM
jgi:hypothetical protein